MEKNILAVILITSYSNQIPWEIPPVKNKKWGAHY